MAKLVQQSTANDPLFFFLVLTSDHISPATGLSPTVTISKNGAAFGAPAGAVTEIANGWYQVAGNATDTNTLGDILLHASVATADNCDLVAAQVIAPNPRNANWGLSNVSANVAQWLGSAPNALVGGKVDAVNSIRTGTAQAGAAGSITLDAGASATNNFYNDDLVLILSGTGAGQVRPIIGYVGSTKVATVTPNWATNPDATSVFVLTTAAYADAVAWLQTAVTAATAGIPDVNVKNYNNVVAQTDANSLPKVDIEDINGNATAAQNVSKANQAIMRGTCSGGTVTTAVCSSITSPASLTASGQLIGRTIIFDSTTATASLQGQASNITASSTGATPTITFTAMTTAPANTDTFSVV